MFISEIKTAYKRLVSNPSPLQNQTLLDFHRKTHMLYGGAIKHRPMNRSFINSIVQLHDIYVREMLKRGMKHYSPLKKV